MKEERITLSWTTSPIGKLTIAERSGAVVALSFEEASLKLEAELRKRFGAGATIESVDTTDATRALEEWLAGDLRAMDRLATDPGGTPFQAKVWAALKRIPIASTTDYGGIAADIGAPGAVRAVGTANGRNPIAILIPCHRVIGRDGELRGYGGGLDRKRWLLDHEARNAARAGVRPSIENSGHLFPPPS